MAKEYLEMGLNSKAIKTTNINHLRKCKTQSKSPNWNYRTKIIKKFRLLIQDSQHNNESQEENSTNAIKRLLMTMSFKSVRRIGCCVLCLATRNSFSPHSKRGCFHFFSHKHNHLIFGQSKLVFNRFKRRTIFPCHFDNAINRSGLQITHTNDNDISKKNIFKRERAQIPQVQEISQQAILLIWSHHVDLAALDESSTNRYDLGALKAMTYWWIGY